MKTNPDLKLFYIKVDMFFYADSEGSAEDKAVEVLEKASDKELHCFDICERGLVEHKAPIKWR